MPRNMRFANAAPGAVDLLVYGDIGEWGDVSAAGFARALKEHEGARVRVCINSYGGEVFAGHAIYSQLRRHKGGVDTVIDGIAASAASIVAMAGDKISMGKGTMMMVHNPWTVAVGEADDMRKTADVLDRVRDNLIAIYEERTGLPREQLQQLLADETWMTAEQAVELGFAHEVTTSVAASIRDHGSHFVANGIFVPMAMGKDHRSIDEDKPMATKIKNPEALITPAASETQEDVKAKAVAEERERGKAIRNASKSLGLPDDFAEQHIADGTSVADFHAAAINKRADIEKAKQPVSDAGRASITAGQDERDKWIVGASTWMLVRASKQALVEKYAAKTGTKIDMDPGAFRGLTMLDLARQYLARIGVNTAGLGKMELAGKALTIRASGGYNGTSDFAVLLENTLHKVLLAAYATQPDTWRGFCKVGSVGDFRDHPRYRRGTFGVLDTVNEHGEFKRKQVPDGEKQVISIGTKGNIIGVTRQMLVNDDMDAFMGLANDFGRAAGLTIEVGVYALLAENAGLGPTMSDGKTLFHADHGNIGAGAALSVAAIDADATLMALQTDISGNEILDLQPAVLLVPRALRSTAQNLNESEFDIDAASAGNPNFNRKPNVVRGLFETVIGTARMTGTRRYMFANPADVPTIEVAFLDGEQEPVLEMQEGWEIDGVEWKVRHDHGTDAVDYRGAVTDAGVASE